MDRALQDITRSNIEDRLECIICSCLPSQNRECPSCAHILCDTCLQLWANSQSQGRTSNLSVSCPICREVTVFHNWRHNIALQRVINDVIRACELCNRMICFGETESHLNECPRVITNCRNINCTVECERELLETHESECEYRSVACKCNQNVIYRDLKFHQSKMCNFGLQLVQLIELVQESISVGKKYKKDDFAKLQKLFEIEKHLTKNFTIAVVGEYGSGRTTFVNAILGVPVLATKTATSHVKIRYANSDFPIYKLRRQSEATELTIDRPTFEQLCYSEEGNERTNPRTLANLAIEGSYEVLGNNNLEIIDTRGNVMCNDADLSILIIHSLNLQSQQSYQLYKRYKDSGSNLMIVVTFCDIVNVDKVKEEAYRIYGNDVKGFVSPAKALEGTNTQWNQSISELLVEIGYFLSNNSLKSRLENPVLSSFGSIYREMEYLRLMNETDSVPLKLIYQLLQSVTYGIDEIGVDSAPFLAERYLKDCDCDDKCVESLIHWQSLLNSGAGFLSGIGGFASLVITIPGSMLTMWFIGARLAAAIAYVYGHDIADPNIQEIIIMCLLNEDKPEELRNRIAEANIAIGNNDPLGSQFTIQNRTNSANRVIATQIARKAFSKTATQVSLQMRDKLAEKTATSLGKRLVGQVSSRTLQRAIPLLGGAIAGYFDMAYCKQVGRLAQQVFAN